MTRPRRESSGGRPRSPSRHNRYQAPSTLTSAGWSPSPSITKSSIPVSNHSFFPYTDTADDSVASKSCLSLRLTPRSRWSLRSRGSNSSRSTSQSDPDRRVSRQRNNRLQLDQPTVLRDKASQRWQAFPSAPSANITAVSTSDDSANPSPTNRHENSKIVPNASKDTVQQSKPTIGTPNTQDNNNNGNLVSERTLSLLTPPTPSDRTERFRGTSYAEPQILSQSQQPVRRGLYQGELEPHGVRGQQAPVVAPATTPTLPDGMPGLRSFERTHTFHANNATHRNRHSASYSEATREDRPQGERNEESHLQFSPTTGQVLSSSPAAIPVAIVEESEDCSTDSDTELQKLKDAFLADVRAPSPLEFQRSQELQSSSRQASQFSSQEPQSQTPTQPATASPVTGPPEALSLHTAEVDILNTQAMKSVQEQDYNRALGIFTEVLDIHRQQNGLSHATVASAYHNLGTVHARRAGTFPDNSLSQQNSRQEALNCFQAAARTARDALGPNHPNVAVSLVRIGFLLLQSKEYQSAVITFREALRVRIAHYGATHGLVANLYNNLGVCEMHLEKFPVGLEYLESALQIQRNAVDAGMPPEHRQATRLELADTLFNIGGLCLEWIRRQGPDVRRATEAEHAFEEALKIRRDVLGPDDPLVHQVQVLLEMARSVPRPRKGLTSPVLSPNRSRTPIRRAFDDKPTAIHETAVVGMETAIQPTKPFRHSASNNREVSLLSLHSCNQLGEHVQSFSPSRPQASRPFDEARGCVKDVQLDAWKELLPNDETYGKSIGRTMTPMLEAKVSQDQEEDGGTEDIRGERNFPIPPHFITKHLASESLHKSKSCFSTKTDRRSLHENLKAHDSQKVNLGGISVPMNMSYDGDENCLISDTGVDSEHGRIHYPVTWNKAGIVANEITENPKRRDIIAARSFPSAKVASEILMRPNGSSGKDSEEAKYDFERDVLTGNKERDNVMARVRAVLSAHAQDESTEDTSDIQRAAQNNFRGASVLEQDLMEDGIAPLEGNWPSSNGSASARQMLQDPMNNLFDIHIKASSLLKKNNNVEALRLFKVVLQCQRQRNGPIHMGVGAALHNVGIAELRAQNHEGALRYFEEAARVRKGALGRDHPLVAVTMVKVGISLLLLHRFEEALRSFREALSIRKHALGALHPSTARIYNNIGCVYVEFNEFREACLAFESALDIQRNSLSHDADSGPLIFATATTLCNLGYLYRYRDMYTKAASVLKEAASLQESVLGRSHASVLSTLDNLADSCANSGQADDALKYYDMVLERFRAGGKVRSPKVLRAEAVLLYKMSRVHKQNNDFEAQLDILKLALRAICAYSDATPGNRTDTLERRIEYDANACREELQKNGFDRI